jgi:dipeptidyl aminopeptidase/acylaminoacyl peptidase
MNRDRKLTSTILLVIAAGALATSMLVLEASDVDSRDAMYQRYLELGSLIKGGHVETCWGGDDATLWYRTHDAGWRVDIGKEAVVREDESGYMACTEERSERISQADTPRSLRPTRWMFSLSEIPSPDGTKFAHLKDHDLWLRKSGTDELERLTEDGSERAYWAGEEQPWAWWSPDGSMLAIKRVDTTGVPRYRTPGSEGPGIWFSSVGDPLPRLQLHIVDIPSQEERRIRLGGDPEKWVTVLGWRQDGSELIVLTLDRPHKHMRLLAVSTSTGKVRQILSETRATFHMGTWSRAPVFIPVADDQAFIWGSEKDGFFRLYRYDYSGKETAALTPGTFPVHEVKALDETGGWIYFSGHGDEERPYDIHFYRARLDGSALEQLTEGSGMHDVQLSPTRKLFVDTHSSIRRPPTTDLLTIEGEKLVTLATADVSALDESEANRPEEFVATAIDGKTRLYGVLYRPRDFDANKRYPVIEYIYDAPNTTLVPRYFGPGPFYPAADSTFPLDHVDSRALAQLGFIVLLVDGRGTAERGKVFRDAVYRRSPDNVIAEHASVLKQVAASRPYMDLGRVGIFGISAGGYQAMRAVLVAPDTYHAAVAISASSDYENILAGGKEPYFGMIDEFPDAYEAASNIALADQLTGRLLIIHGEKDDILPVDHALRMSEALKDAEREFTLLVFPDQGHYYLGDAAAQARQATREFFESALNPSQSK